MDNSLGELPDSEKIILTSKEKPNELYWGAFHYVVNGIDFIGINIDPNTAFNSHEGSYSNETLTWVKNKLNEIDPDGSKCVFVVGHLSAIYRFSDDRLRESMINGDREMFYDVFKGHRNTFYLYGHLHGEGYCYREYSSGAILHLDKENNHLATIYNHSKTKFQQNKLPIIYLSQNTSLVYLMFLYS